VDNQRAKIGVIFSLVTGAAVALCIDVLNTHDIKLARKMYSFLKPNDVLLGDRAFCAYADMFTIKKLGCDAVFRKHQSRTSTMRKGKIIWDCDKLVIWYKRKDSGGRVLTKGTVEVEYHKYEPKPAVLF
jgi:hypothetical protein